MLKRIAVASAVTGVLCAQAESQLTWDSWVDGDRTIISYQAPGTDHVLFTITCNTSDGRGSLHPGGNALNVNNGERVRVTISGPGGTAAYTGVAQLLELDDTMAVSIDLPSARGALVPLSKPGTLTIRYPTNGYTIPVGPRAAAATKTFLTHCPPAK